MKTILTAVAILTVALCTSAQHRADQQHLQNPESFSMILLGDPQGYIKYDINQPLFELQTAWIADNIDNLNIKEKRKTMTPPTFTGSSSLAQ